MMGRSTTGGPMQGDGAGSDNSGGSSPEGAHISSSFSSMRAAIPCAACKLLRRKCVPECPFAPYFPPSEPHKFACVHKIFGASNVSKMLMEVRENQRADVANSLVYEANARIRDPVYGCLGAISVLQQEAQRLQSELHAVRTQIMRYRFEETAMAAAASAHQHLSSTSNTNINTLNRNTTNQNNSGINDHSSSAAPGISFTAAASSLAISSPQTTVTISGAGEHNYNTIGSSLVDSSTIASAIDMKEHYWSRLHQSC